MQHICPKCGNPTAMLWGVRFCGKCGWKQGQDSDSDEETEVVPPMNRDPLEPIARMHSGRVSEFKGHPFVNNRALELYEDYYDHQVGDIIAVMGPGGSTIFFELAGHVSAERDGDREEGYLLVRIIPEDLLKDWPMIDVDPGEMAMELADGEAADQGRDEAP